MRNTIKGAIIGAFVAAFVSVLLAQTPSWTNPRTWTTDDLLTADQFNAQIRDNFLNLRGFAACAENGVSGTSSAQTVLFGDCRWAAESVFDIHDSVTQVATIADADRMAFADEGSAGDPMRYTTALNFAGYVLSDDSVGSAEMDPESATEGQVMMIGSGGDPAWQFPFEFPRTVSRRALSNVNDGSVTTSTIQRLNRC